MTMTMGKEGLKEATNEAPVGTRRRSAFPDCSIIASTLPVIQIVLKRVLDALHWPFLSISIYKASGLGLVISMPSIA